MAKPTTRHFTECLKIAISEVSSKVPSMTTIEQESAVVEFLTEKDIFCSSLNRIGQMCLALSRPTSIKVGLVMHTQAPGICGLSLDGGVSLDE